MATILIVDDEQVNRELLHAYLEGAEHTLVDADSGEAALAAVATSRPDIVLLDVMMPGMNGFDTAARLKEQLKDEFLPVILVTALHDHDSRLRGLRAGADEFLTKPVDRHELTLRINNLLRLRTKELTLVKRNCELVELQRFRDEMSSLVVHDLKNPLAVMMANIDYVLEEDVNASESHEALLDSKSAGQRALRLLANLADLTRIEVGQLQLARARMQATALLDPLVRQRTHIAQSRAITIHSEIEPAAPIFVDAELISRVVENVFDNAIRHTPPGGRIAVCGTAQPGSVHIRIGNTGRAIPTDARNRIFEKYAQAGSDSGRMNLGLGLYFCRLAAEAHGGKIWVEETRELPTVFNLELPRAGE